MKQALIIFVKNTVYGQVKTRLAATIGKTGALAVYQQLLQYTATVTRAVAVEKMLFYATYVEPQDQWNNDLYNKQLQYGNDLGEKMLHAFKYAFKSGAAEVIIIGSDCFEITAGIIMDAFGALKNNEVVIGPAVDGGYYLLGMKQLHAGLFKQVKWSTGEVLKTTLSICKINDLSVYLLPELNDIDTENDLQKYREMFGFTDSNNKHA